MLYPQFLSTGQVKLDIIRRSATMYDRGRPVEGTEEIVPVTCNVQPVLKSSDTLLIPEGDRSKACLKIYTKGAEIRQLREGENGWAADRFIWQGELYEVMKSINYAMGVLNHWKIIAMRVELT